jgi:hypothetical protein
MQAGNPVTITPSISATYTVIGTDANGCSDLALYTLAVDACVGIDRSQPGSLGLSVYPNPHTGIFTVQNSGDVMMTIYDGLGRTVIRKDLPAGRNEIEMQEQAKGMYFIEFKTGETSKSVKIIKH